MRIQTALATLFIAASVHAGSDTPDLQTKSGRQYRDCHVLKVGADGVTFRHAGGVAKVLFGDMTKAAQQDFGYDPQKEKAYLKEQAEAREKKRELAIQRAQEAAKAYEEARQRALENQTLLALQQSAMIQTALAQQASQGGGYVFGAVGLAPYGAYGPYALDGRAYANNGNVNRYCTPPASQSLFGHYGALVNFPGVNYNSYGNRFQGYRHGVVRPMGGGWSAPAAPCPPVRSVNAVGGGH